MNRRRRAGAKRIRRNGGVRQKEQLLINRGGKPVLVNAANWYARQRARHAPR